ncbi:hypothetical protein [Palaeococcus ferrophilus]|uniref:hypothetical protein n=1 Tax=Palaeococcus ferrophilus TaxID=83868 RepID=UPI00064F2E01|nr:hypothetical protein [Palaeococcus ferrophilus]
MNEKLTEQRNPMMKRGYAFSVVFIISIIELTVFSLSKVGDLITAGRGDLAIIGIIIFVPALATLLFLSYLHVPAGEFGALAVLITPLTILPQSIIARMLNPRYYDESGGVMVVAFLFYCGFFLGMVLYRVISKASDKIQD